MLIATDHKKTIFRLLQEGFAARFDTQGGRLRAVFFLPKLM